MNQAKSLIKGPRRKSKNPYKRLQVPKKREIMSPNIFRHLSPTPTMKGLLSPTPTLKSLLSPSPTLKLSPSPPRLLGTNPTLKVNKKISKKNLSGGIL